MKNMRKEDYDKLTKDRDKIQSELTAILEGDRLYCRKCTRYRPRSLFYDASDALLDTNGKFSICKDCANELLEHFLTKYEKNYELAIVETCKSLNVAFNLDALHAFNTHLERLTEKKKVSKKIFGIYKSKLQTIGKANGIINFTFDYNSVKNRDDKIIEHKDLEISEDDCEFWGSVYKKQEIVELNETYGNYVAMYPHDTPVQLAIYKEIAYVTLKLKQATAGENVNVTQYEKLHKIWATLHNNVNINPVQSTGANATEQTTFGTLIRQWEYTDPIPKVAPEYRDIDKLKLLMRVYFYGHLGKMMGKNIDNLTEYEEELARHTVELSDPFYDEEDEDELDEDSIETKDGDDV
jgi:hypothetical protein